MTGVATHPLDRLREFFAVRIWDVRPAELPRAKAALFRASRLAYSTVRGFFENRLTVRAAALTYYSVLSVVPFLAFAFAVLKGFGAYRAFVDGFVRPYLADTFGPNPALFQASERILEFVDRTDVSRLGAVGLVVLVYTSVSLVSSIEVALNDVFGVKTTRPFLRQITDYVTLLVTTPILVFAAATLSTAAQSSSVVVFLRERLGLGPAIDFALGFTPVAVVALALFAMYVILPNVRVRPLSALLGAVLAAIGWQGSLVLHVQLQMGVANYNALYSVLGAIPIFLVWTYVSWLIVLVGAETAASHQNEQVVRERLRGQRADQALKEVLAVATAAQVARDYLAGATRRTPAELAQLLEVPPAEVEEILEALARAGLLVRTVAGPRVGYVPGRDVDAVRVSDLREALRREPRADDVRAAVLRRLGAELQRLLHAAEEERRSSPHNATLRELAALAREPAPSGVDGAGAGRPGGPAGDRPEVLDAKQPETPA
ncbi:YhjD/YihY/BrkB family envelope integrity protein [Anaeromyxobacter terrae]|uniref:YhjD/YihY/BrkB family envelope integrity protein n=1 Tax=Anaeromyxobacter terrae TaxID=2925406 RepID=UPI001F564328|nr:YhjD/YihY/BrkB family envelope integrity protein [Anaeromyxobacter sp. SG22]